MLKYKDTNARIDAIHVGSGEFNVGIDDTSSIMLTVAYYNLTSGASMGTCRVPESALSTETLEAFDAFLRLAERDYGKIVFEGASPEESVTETSPLGLPPGLGELKQ